MNFDVITSPAELASLRGEWSGLSAPSPMQSLDWLEPWWKAYRTTSRELFIVAGRRDGRLVGVAPWYCETRRGNRCVRSLGDGHVCSDHATLLTRTGHRTAFGAALADWLLTDAADQWRQLSLDSIDVDDPAYGEFGRRLADAGCPSVHRNEHGSCYVDLPRDWEDYLAAVSKNHRKRCRKWRKEFFDSGRASVSVARTPDDCLAAWDTMVSLHNARRSRLGEQGAFEDRQFAAFHHAAIPRLAASGRLQIRLLSVDRQTVAAEYVLQDSGVWYAYQSGMSAAGEALSAGSLSVLAPVRDAVAAGCRRLDLLRGTEAYKFSWGAVHRPAASLRVRQPNYAGRLAALRDTALLAARDLKARVTSRA